MGLLFKVKARRLSWKSFVDLLLRLCLCSTSTLLSWRPLPPRGLPSQVSHCVLLFPPEVLMLEGRPDLPLQVAQMAQLSVWDPGLS